MISILHIQISIVWLQNSYVKFPAFTHEIEIPLKQLYWIILVSLSAQIVKNMFDILAISDLFLWKR